MLTYKNILLLLLFAFIATLALMPLASNTNLPLNGDFYHHLIAISQAKTALLQGQFPLRVVPTLYHEWLYPTYQFYGTTTYTLAGFFHIVFAPQNPLIAFKMTLWFAIVFGGIYMFLLAKELLGHTGAAVLTSVCFLLSPYLLLIINHLAAFNEAVGLLLLPAVIYYTLQRYHFPKKISYLLLASLFWYLLATTHLITFVLSCIFVGLFLFFITLRNKQWIKLFDTGIAFAFGLMLSIWQLAPIFLFALDLKIHESFNDSLIFFLKSPTLLHLLSPVGHISELLRSTKRADFNTVILMNPNIGLPILLGFSMTCYALFKKIKIQKPIDDNLALIFFLFLCAFFLAWSPFNFWQWLPSSFRFMQYPYRFLGQCAWMGALLFGFSITWIFSNKIKLKYSFAIFVFLILSSSYWLVSHQDKMYYLPQMTNTKNFNIDYIMDTQQNPHRSALVDTIVLDSKNQHETMLTLAQLKPVGIQPKSLSSFFIVLKGEIPDIPVKEKTYRIGFFINHSLIQTYPLQLGNLYLSHKLSSNDQMQILTFAIVDKNKKIVKNPEVKIPIEYFSLRGLLKTDTMMNVEATQPFCRSQKNSVYCSIDVPEKTSLIELPIFYYPDLLRLTVNDQLTPYHSIFYNKYLIMAFTPSPGKNNIVVTFTGLRIANLLSLIFWLIWLLLFLQQIFLQKPK